MKCLHMLQNVYICTYVYDQYLSLSIMFEKLIHCVDALSNLFHFMAIMNNDAMTFTYKYFCGCYHSE